MTHDKVDEAEVLVLAEVPQPLCALVAPEHPLAGKKSLRLRECVAYPLAIPDETLAARTLIDAALGGASIRFEPALLSNSIETTKMFARTSGGVCFSFKIGKKPDVSGMIAVPLSDPGLSEARLSLAGRRGRVLPVAAAAFAEQLSAMFEEL
jgi:hypothetical protein